MRYFIVFFFKWDVYVIFVFLWFRDFYVNVGRNIESIKGVFRKEDFKENFFWIYRYSVSIVKIYESLS